MQQVKSGGTNIGDVNILRIDPATNTIDLTVPVVGSGGHYTYSDMTGNVARTITTKTGTWTVDFDSGANNMPWGTVSWTSNEPTGTSVKVEVRSSNDKSAWSEWETVSNGVLMTSTPPGEVFTDHDNNADLQWRCIAASSMILLLK